MRIIESRGDFKGNLFVIGTSDKAQYQPFYSVCNRGRLELFSYSMYLEPSEYVVEGDFYYYMKPDITDNNYSYLGTYGALFSHLEENIGKGVYKFDYKDVSYLLHVFKGCIIDNDNNILLMLSVKDEKVFQRGHIEKLDYSKFKLFISNRLITNDIYTNFYKKLYSEFIEELIKLEVDTVFCDSKKIEDVVFDNNFNVQFNTLSELNEHLSSGIGNLLFKNYSEYQNTTDAEEFIDNYILTNPMTSDGASEIVQLEENQVNPIISIPESVMNGEEYFTNMYLNTVIPSFTTYSGREGVANYEAAVTAMSREMLRDGEYSVTNLNQEDFTNYVNNIQIESDSDSNSEEDSDLPF